MFQENYLKKTIKKAYKQYVNKKTDEQSTLADVAKLFNIPIDESRLSDYEIRTINFNEELSMDLLDKKTNTEFKSKYTYSYKLNGLRYINVTATNSSKRSENIYYIGDNDPIIKKITFIDGKYKLTFEKERPNDAGVYYVNANTKFTIKYSIDNDDKDEKEICLLSKTIQKHDDGEFVYDFERTKTNQHIAIKKNLDFQNKHAFIESDNVMYGIDFFQSDLHNRVQGALFESTKISHIREHFPSSMDLYIPSSKFEDKNTMSAIILMGYVGEGNYSELEIYKTIEGIVGSYCVKTFSTDGQLNRSESKNDFQLPNLDKKMISSKEINYLLKYLRSRFGDDFIELISNDLLEFAKKIDIRKNILEEELDLLSPRLFFDKPIEEVENMVESEKERYFKLAADQYFTISHQKQKNDQVKILKPNNSLQSYKN